MGKAGTVCRARYPTPPTARGLSRPRAAMRIVLLTLVLLLASLATGAAVFAPGHRAAGPVMDVIFLVCVGGFLASLVMLIRRRVQVSVAAHLARIEAEHDEDPRSGSEPEEGARRHGQSGAASDRRSDRASERQGAESASRRMDSMRLTHHQSGDVRDGGSTGSSRGRTLP